MTLDYCENEISAWTDAHASKPVDFIAETESMWQVDRRKGKPIYCLKPSIIFVHDVDDKIIVYVTLKDKSSETKMANR